MIRAPLLNSVLGAARTAQQLLLRRNAFEEAVGPAAAQARVPSSSSSQPRANAPRSMEALELRALGSCSLWFIACARARRAISRALDAADPVAMQEELTRFGTLMKLGATVGALGALGLSKYIVAPILEKWYTKAIRDGVSRGLVVPGSTTGIPAKRLLHIRVEPATADLMVKEMMQRQKYEATLQKGLAGSGFLNLTDEDLTGLSMPMRSVWASTLGSGAVWRSTKYKVPVGHDAMNRILPFCQNAETRRRFFEAYYANFHGEVETEALELLRARRELAERLGFRTWAEYELKPLAVADPSSAHRLLDEVWRDAKPALAPMLRRMEELLPAASGAAAGTGLGDRRAAAKAARGEHTPLSSRVPHVDSAFLRALVTREADTWKLAEFLPADASLPRILDVVGRAYNVEFREVHKPELGDRLSIGWHKSVHIYEVTDGPPASASVGGAHGRLGFVYLDMYQRSNFLGRPSVQLAGAALLCPGHAHVSMNLPPAGLGRNKLLNPEEMVAIAHEVGHAVHMLCHKGSVQEFDDMPLDLAELPSTLMETIALQPSIVSQYARHYASGGPPPDSLVKSCQRDVNFFVRYLQSSHVALGLHGEGFDPHAASPEDLRAKSVELWQRYSPFEAHPGYTPLGEDAGPIVGQGATHIAYLLCYLRVDAILHGQAQGVSSRGSPRWLSPDFAGRVRSQLLDRQFPGQRLATLLPPLVGEEGASGSRAAVAPLPHPLPPPPQTGAALMARATI